MAQNVDIGLVCADMAEIGNTDRRHKAFLPESDGSAAFLVLPVETGNDQDTFGIGRGFADIQIDLLSDPRIEGFAFENQAVHRLVTAHQLDDDMAHGLVIIHEAVGIVEPVSRLCHRGLWPFALQSA
ncbi:hypothetical protein D3C87_1747530 [compost metagenome]